MKEKLKKAKEASIKMSCLSSEDKNNAISEVISLMRQRKHEILQANNKDLEHAKNKVSEALIKRLRIDEIKLDEMISGLMDVKSLEDPSGKVIEKLKLDQGLILEKVSCPIGVIGVIFESRPDALVQIASLCLKSGNSVVLKGGSEAANSNQILFQIFKDLKGLPEGWIQLLQTREEVAEILKCNEYVDLLIPRGSNKFVKFIEDNTKIPVLGHSEGLCHIYIDEDANLEDALEIAVDAKCQYPAACNAVETILVHKSLADSFLPALVKKLKENNVQVRLDPRYKLPGTVEAKEEDWKEEYNDLAVSIKVVDNLEDAISHINHYGSGHTDAIITEDEKKSKVFLSNVDSACVFWNCSTRFSDGYRFGKGAEVGISTSKIHARGPVGVEGLVIHKYLLKGKGHLVRQYSGEHAKKFLHEKI